MEDRRRFDAAYILLDDNEVIPVPRRFEAAYETLSSAHDILFLTPTPAQGSIRAAGCPICACSTAVRGSSPG